MMAMCSEHIEGIRCHCSQTEVFVESPVSAVLRPAMGSPSLRVCKQYLNGELPNGPFRLFHKSFADFLLEEDANTDFRVDGAAMHSRIAEQFFAKHRGKWDECED